MVRGWRIGRLGAHGSVIEELADRILAQFVTNQQIVERRI
jgi:hypothetical protein